MLQREAFPSRPIMLADAEGERCRARDGCERDRPRWVDLVDALVRRVGRN
jgi:hypothetical protein